MKKVFYSLYLLLAILACVTTGCDEEHDNVRPGLYVENRHIESFPGDTVLISGQVSNYVGLASINLTCEDWKLNMTDNFDGQCPKVYNFSYKIPIPIEAEFDRNLMMTVTDKNGLESKQVLLCSFLPDTQQPVMKGISSYVAIDFDINKGKGIWNLNIQCEDDRQLEKLRLKVPQLGLDESVKINKNKWIFERSVEFTQVGNFDGSITLADISGNVSELKLNLSVIPTELENPIEDYSQMYLVSNTEENPEDYLNGYYRYMKRINPYQYQVKLHAENTEDGFLFVPTQTMDKDVFGASPWSNNKILNNKDYVVPVRMETPGYYTITIDLQNHNYVVEPLNTSSAYTGEMFAGGDGFRSWDNWGLMQKKGQYFYQIEAEQDGGAAPEWGRYYYFYGGWINSDGSHDTDWKHVFRADSEGKEWYETEGGNGAVNYQSDYDGKVLLTIDTAIPWGTIKKIN